MSGAEEEQIELSSESDPEDIDLDLIHDIKVDENDLVEIDRLIATTKHQLGIPSPTQKPENPTTKNPADKPSISFCATFSSSTK